MQELEAFLEEIDQLHLLEGIEVLAPLEFEEYKNQIMRFNATFFRRQRAMLADSDVSTSGEFEQVEVSCKIAPKISAEQLGCVILSGGDGTRLGLKGPKGCVEVVKGKSLFRVLIEKCPRQSPIAVIVSENNRHAVERHFEENGWFGRSRGQLRILVQKMWPLMSRQGEWISTDMGQLALAPNGNGEALQELYLSGCARDWEEMGVKHVSISPVDNPLSEIGDLSAIDPSVDLCLKSVPRRDPTEKVGIIAQKEGRPFVLEYIYKQPAKFETAFTGMFTCSLAWLMEVAEHDLPWHRVEKQGRYRFETHVYDLFPFAKSFRVIEVEREREFSPIKRLEGKDSLQEARKKLEKMT